MTAHNPLLCIDSITAKHQQRTVLSDITLHVNNGDIIGLLGPSGCGKTTLLRTIAGLHAITGGSIKMQEENLSTPAQMVAPEKRGVGFMFQDLALFPHLTIHGNVAYGLRQQKKTYVDAQVKHVLDLVEIGDQQYQKYPHELSGGQQQRVALARALAPKPSILLLDEPFSSLDPDLRAQLTLQVRKILKRENMTTVLVTHDQQEAFTMADQIGVMHCGNIIQFDTPYDIYHQPASRFVAEFIGIGSFIPAQIIGPDCVDTIFGRIEGELSTEFNAGEQVQLLVRPDDIPHDDNSDISAIVEEKRFMGAEFLYTLRLPDNCLIYCYAPSHHNHAVGQPLGIGLNLEHLVAFRR